MLEVETKASIAGWDIRKMVQVTVTEMEALPLLEICLRCPAPATMRCQQCGSRSYYCKPCFLHNHTISYITTPRSIFFMWPKSGRYVCISSQKYCSEPE